MVPASTSCAPHQSTPTTLAETMKMIEPVSSARARLERRAAAKAASAASANRAAVILSMPKACMVRIAPTASAA